MNQTEHREKMVALGAIKDEIQATKETILSAENILESQVWQLHKLLGSIPYSNKTEQLADLAIVGDVAKAISKLREVRALL